MKTLNLSWLEDFLVLSASGNFSRAAQERHMTQPAFSRRIRALEAWLGADLFDRSGQPATLTETGRWLVDAATDLLKRSAQLPGQAQRIARDDALTLRIASTHALSLTFLPQWLRNVEQHLALGPISLVSDVLPRCEAMLMQDQVQFVLCHGHAEVPGALGLQGSPSRVVGQDHLIPVSVPTKAGKPRHRLAPSRARALVLNYSADSGIGRILKAVKGPQIAALATEDVITAHTASVLRSMVLDGRGLAWLPSSLIADDLARGVLVEAAPSAWQVRLDILLFRARTPLSKAGEAFWDAAAPS